MKIKKITKKFGKNKDRFQVERKKRFKK